MLAGPASAAGRAVDAALLDPTADPEKPLSAAFLGAWAALPHHRGRSLSIGRDEWRPDGLSAWPRARSWPCCWPAAALAQRQNLYDGSGQYLGYQRAQRRPPEPLRCGRPLPRLRRSAAAAGSSATMPSGGYLGYREDQPSGREVQYDGAGRYLGYDRAQRQRPREPLRRGRPLPRLRGAAAATASTATTPTGATSATATTERPRGRSPRSGAAAPPARGRGCRARPDGRGSSGNTPGAAAELAAGPGQHPRRLLLVSRPA